MNEYELLVRVNALFDGLFIFTFNQVAPVWVIVDVEGDQQSTHPLIKPDAQEVMALKRLLEDMVIEREGRSA